MLDTLKPGAIIAFLMLCGIRNIFHRDRNTNTQNGRSGSNANNSLGLDSAPEYEYFSAKVLSPSASVGDLLTEYSVESTHQNVRRNKLNDTWEVFRVGYGEPNNEEYHQGRSGLWKILDPEHVLIMKKRFSFSSPQLVFHD